MIRTACLLLAILTTGCATRTQTVSVPVPTKCTVATPARPDMPTDALNPMCPAKPAQQPKGCTTLERFTAAAIAEILRREAYELELVAALSKCADPAQ